MLHRVRLLAAAALMGALSACAPSLGPPPPGRMIAPPPPPPSDDSMFRAGDFAWSQTPGRNALSGSLAHVGPVRYSCAGATVVLTPETPWARRRMEVLYRSDQRASLPADDVRSRAAQAPAGDSGPYVRKVACDAADHFSFTGLADGAWYVVVLAKPVAPATGPSIALMRRVVTKGGKVTPFDI